MISVFSSLNFRAPTSRFSRALAFALLSSLLGCGSSKLRPDVLEGIRAGTDVIQSPEAIDVPMVGGPAKPMVEVRLNGRGPYRFLVDLGGNVVSVRRDVAKQAHLDVVQELETRGVVKADLAVGATTFKHVMMVREPELDVEGVIGFNLFRRGLVVLDYPAQRLAWRPGFLPAADGRSVVAYQLRERMPYVRARIANKLVWANLDTGAAHVELVVPATSEGTYPTKAPAKVAHTLWNQAEGNIRTREAQLNGDLAIGGNVAKLNPTITFSPALEDETLIGSGALTDLRLTLDTASRRMRIEQRHSSRN